MKKIIVIYKSQYGATKQYAQWIAQALDAKLCEATQVKPNKLIDYDLVIYGGGIYASNINGISLVTKNPVKQLIVFSVALTPPEETTFYQKVLTKNIPQELQNKTRIFNFQGAIKVDKLRFMHQTIIKALRKAASKKPVNELNDVEKAFIEGNGNFVKQEAINPLVEYVKTLT